MKEQELKRLKWGCVLASVASAVMSLLVGSDVRQQWQLISVVLVGHAGGFRVAEGLARANPSYSATDASDR